MMIDYIYEQLHTLFLPVGDSYPGRGGIYQPHAKLDLSRSTWAV